LTFNEITSRLQYIAERENLKVDDGALSVMARMAEGSMRDALSLLEQARAYCGDDIHDEPVHQAPGVRSDPICARAMADSQVPRATLGCHRLVVNVVTAIRACPAPAAIRRRACCLPPARHHGKRAVVQPSDFLFPRCTAAGW